MKILLYGCLHWLLLFRIQIQICKYLPLENQQYPISGLYFIRFSSENKYEAKLAQRTPLYSPGYNKEWKKSWQEHYSHAPNIVIHISQKTLWNLRDSEPKWHLALLRSFLLSRTLIVGETTYSQPFGVLVCETVTSRMDFGLYFYSKYFLQG